MDMCNYSVTIDDAVMEEVRPNIAKGIAEDVWVELQVRALFEQMAQNNRKAMSQGQTLSQRLRGIGHAPKDFDYKKELEERF